MAGSRIFRSRLANEDGGMAISAAILFPAMLMFLLMMIQVCFWGVGHMAAEAAARRGAAIAGHLNPSQPPGGGTVDADAECAAAAGAARAEAAARAERWNFARLRGRPAQAVRVTWNVRWVEVEVRMRTAISFFGWDWPITATARSHYDNWGETNLFCS